MKSLDEYVKKCPEVYQVSPDRRFSRINEFSFDDITPPFNCLVVWEEPKKGFDYTIGVDPGWGLGQDRSVIHVLRNGTMYTPDAQVAEFTSDDINMHDLTPICDLIGRLYGNALEEREALMSPECNLSDTIAYDLRYKYNYGNIFIWKYYERTKNLIANKMGWWTTPRTRPKLINKAMQYVNKGWWDISSPWMIAEMETIEKLEDEAQIKAAQGMHDDLFMAGAIALWSAHDMEFSEGFGLDVAQERVKRTEALVVAASPQGGGRKATYRNTPCSYEEMYRGFEE